MNHPKAHWSMNRVDQRMRELQEWKKPEQNNLLGPVMIIVVLGLWVLLTR